MMLSGAMLCSRAALTFSCRLSIVLRNVWHCHFGNACCEARSKAFHTVCGVRVLRRIAVSIDLPSRMVPFRHAAL